MSEDNTFKRRSACWQIVVGDKNIDVIHDGVTVSVHDANDLWSVGYVMGRLVKSSVRAMKENDAKHLILMTSWE